MLSVNEDLCQISVLKAGRVQVELCREVAVPFLLVTDGALSGHHGKILSLEGMGPVVIV